MNVFDFSDTVRCTTGKGKSVASANSDRLLCVGRNRVVVLSKPVDTACRIYHWQTQTDSVCAHTFLLLKTLLFQILQTHIWY